MALKDIDFNFSTFWVHVHALPFQYINKENVEKIARLVGRVNFIEDDIEQSIVGTMYMRFSVEVDIIRPLVVGFFHKQRFGGTWIQLCYERMANMCYKCGNLGI